MNREHDDIIGLVTRLDEREETLWSRLALFIRGAVSWSLTVALPHVVDVRLTPSVVRTSRTTVGGERWFSSVR
ncbi:MAG: hypothetical protein U5K73_00005 [Halofilum sp. (in: g-proteobacteria)]|nr:hypothetical protein [Halofilum sp. (in: g-proteobacteria)]